MNIKCFAAVLLLLAVQVRAQPIVFALSDFSEIGRKGMTVQKQVDLDEDGLLDTVQVRLQRDGAEQWPAVLHPGRQLTLRVESIDFTLASGECGAGRFLEFSGVGLDRNADMLINKTLQAGTRQSRPVTQKGRSITLQAPVTAAAPITVNEVQFEVMVDPAHTLAESWEIGLIAMHGLAPLLLLLLRRGAAFRPEPLPA